MSIYGKNIFTEGKVKQLLDDEDYYNSRIRGDGSDSSTKKNPCGGRENNNYNYKYNKKDEEKNRHNKDYKIPD